MSDREFERAVADWFDDRTDRAPEPAIEAVLLAVRSTPQERDLWIPWRLPRMTGLARAVVVATVALVVMVGAGGLIFLNTTAPGGVGGGPSPAASPSPTASPAGSAAVAPSIDVPAGWAPFTSPVYGYTLAYPAEWKATPAATRGAPDLFVSRDDEIGIGVSKVPAGDGADVATGHGLMAWAQDYCTSARLGACDTYPQRTEAMCLAAAAETCRAAILVRSEGKNPTDEGEYAFFGDWANVSAGGAPDRVVVVGVGRGDTYPAAAPFGGAVQLLKTMLFSMGVSEMVVGAPAPSGTTPGITAWTPSTSTVYGNTISYPEGWEPRPATRAWRQGDGSGGIEAYADLFGSPDGELGVAVWQVPVGDGANIDTIDGLEAWAATFCKDTGGPNCDTLRTRAESLCLNAGGDPCRAATLVRSEGTNPADDSEMAFFPDWTSQMFTGAPDKVTVVMVGRGDTYPAAAQYGGAVQLLTSFLSRMGVTPR